MVNEIFCSDKKIGAIFGPFFGPKFGHFCSKIRFLDIFYETAHQICLKLGQKLGTVALNHIISVLCLGKFLYWSFCHFGVQNTLHVVTLYGFGLFLGIFFKNVDDFRGMFGILTKFIVYEW